MKLNQSELSRLFRGLSALLHAGISPGEGLYLLAREEPEHEALLNGLGARLDGGETLSGAMGEAFPGWAVGMVSVGEETGRLEEALSFLADYCDEAVRTRRILRESLAYPLVLFALMLVVIGVLLTRVLPVFDRVYGSLGISLSGLAGWLLALGAGLERALPVLWAAVGLALAAGGGYRFSPSFQSYVNAKCRKAFGDRGVLRDLANARFARGLAMGIGSGMTAEEALSLAGRLLADDPGAAARCARAEALVEKGEDLSAALEAADLLPPARCRMLAVGLRSGNVDRILTDLADRMEEDAARHLSDLLAKVEPALVLVTAGLVGVILLSVMVPLLDILAALG